MATASLAWIDTGHMIVAAIAERRLTPVVRKKVDDLLKVGATDKAADFITAACWADDKKKETGTDAWHYINFHFRADGKPNTNQPAKPNIVDAIDNATFTLKNKTKSDAERADALRYLLHFVGDIHQPLHAAALDSDAHPEGDRGGNDFPIVPGELLKNMEQPPLNLHALWDTAGGELESLPRPLAAESLGRILIQADRFATRYPAKRFTRQLAVVDPNQWALESFELARDVAYTTKPDAAPTDAYMRMCRLFSEQRMVLAGYRLANLLNRILDEPVKGKKKGGSVQ